MSDPGWVEHAIWWQIYPLGFVGAYPADPPPGPDEHRLRRIAEWFDRAIELAASGTMPLDPVISKVVPLEGLGDAFRELDRGGDVMKILIRCSE